MREVQAAITGPNRIAPRSSFGSYTEFAECPYAGIVKDGTMVNATAVEAAFVAGGVDLQNRLRQVVAAVSRPAFLRWACI